MGKLIESIYLSLSVRPSGYVITCVEFMNSCIIKVLKDIDYVKVL